MARRILITGCSGFLARYLIAHLKTRGCNRIAGLTEEPDFVHPDITVFHVDIRDSSDLANAVKEVRPEITFHLAAISNVGFAWKNQRLTYEVNFLGSVNLMEALALHAARSRLLLMSTAEIYRFDEGVPANEQTAIVIRTPYSLSKWAMEMAADLYLARGLLQIIKIRCFNFTGPGQDRKFVASDFAAQIAEVEKGRREAVLQTGNLEVRRDFSDVRDIADGVAAIAETGPSPGVFNLCSGKSYTVRQLLDILRSFSTVPIAVASDPEKIRPAEVPFMAGDGSLLRNTLGIYPRIAIEKTLRDLLADWREKIG